MSTDDYIFPVIEGPPGLREFPLERDGVPSSRAITQHRSCLQDLVSPRC